MKKTYTRSEMLGIWRVKLGFDIPRTDCTVEVFEGIDVDAAIALKMRQWYLQLLYTAAPEHLPVENVAATATPAAVAAPNCKLYDLPANCRRVVEVRCPEWLRPALPVDAADSSVQRRIARLASPYAAPQPSSPIAAVSGSSLLIAPCQPEAQPQIMAVVDPGDTTYILDESLLSTIPETLIHL